MTGYQPVDEKNSPNAQLPPHLIGLPGGKWALWRWFGLRGAGFPASQVLQLAASDCANVADRILALDAETRRLRSEAITALQQDIPSADAEGRILLEKAVKRLQKFKPAPRIEIECSGKASAEAFSDALARLDATLAEFNTAFEADAARVSRTLREIAATPRFREAVIWQNRRAMHTGINPLLGKNSSSELRGSKLRQHEELVAKYLQRYCLKNDTIGFFGPVGWGKLLSEGEAITVEPGDQLLAKRKVYFEGWCIDELAEKIASDRALQPWFVPRRRPSIRIENETLHLPFGGKQKLAPVHAAVLRACDGERIAKDIAAELIGNPAGGLGSEEDVYNILGHFNKRGLIFWTFEIPIVAHPELVLQKLLERVDDTRLSRDGLARLGELVAFRDAISAAMGDAEKLDNALNDLETAFTRVTGLDSVRSPGLTYGARTLVYEDCRRDINLEIGPEVLQPLYEPLELILTSARWFTYLATVFCRDIFEKIYRELTRELGTRKVDILSFWIKLKPFLYDEKTAIADKLLEIFQQRWEGAFNFEEGQRDVHYTAAELRPYVLSTFDVPEEHSRYVRYHSPDVMIAAESVEAIRKGDFRFVLGELHVAMNTLGYLLFLEMHPAPEELFRARDLDIPEQQVLPIVPKDFFGGAMRTHTILRSAKDFRLDFAPERAGDSPIGSVPVSEFVIEDEGDGLFVHTHDGRQSFEAIQFFITSILQTVSTNFKMKKPKHHNPRISIDRLIISRESWSFPYTELEFINEMDGAKRFMAARRWAAARGIPRFVFVKVPIELKPFYLDFDSPIYLDIFSKVARRMSREDHSSPFITFTEMLPGPDQLWLPDIEDNRYTSELRIVVVDCAGREPFEEKS
jgi:hypothetical protein